MAQWKYLIVGASDKKDGVTAEGADGKKHKLERYWDASGSATALGERGWELMQTEYVNGWVLTLRRPRT